jgi:hypothetical protein
VSFLRAAVKRVVGLFVGDWVQTAVVLVIIATAWLAYARLGPVALVLLVVLLAGQLVLFARAEAKRPKP